MSLSTGIIGGPEINCHNAVEIGLKSMETMIDKAADETSLTKLYQVKPLSVAAGTMHLLNGDYVKVDSQLLLQRLSAVFKSNMIC